MDPILLSIAGAVAGKTTEAVFKGSQKAVEAVRRRFGGGSEEAVVLERLEDGEASVEDLARTIEKVCAADPKFRAELGEIVGQRIQIAQSGMFNNVFNGEGPKNVIQADTIHNLRLD